MHPLPGLKAAPVLLLLALGAACVRFFPAPETEPPPLTLERHILCAALERRDGWAEPGWDRRVFDAGRDETVVSFIEFRQLSGVHALAWKWYDPGRALYRSTEPITVGEAGRVFGAYIAWDEIAITKETAKGIWTAAVFADGGLAGIRTFEVR
jgi:hypothetical protein